MRVTLLGIIVLTGALIAQGQGSPEEQAITDILLAKDAAKIEKHLPEALCNALDSMDRAARDEILARPLAVMKMKGLKVSQGSDGQALAAFDVDAPDAEIKHFELRVSRRVSNGAEAVLVLDMVAPEKIWGGGEVWMKLQDGEWRVAELKDPTGYGHIDLEDPDTIAEFLHTPAYASEAAAVGTLRMLLTALITYNARFPEVGFPDKLDVLGGDPKLGEPDSEHTQYIDPELARTHVKTGYRFDYQRISPDSFQIIARPLQFGKNGGKNFFVDETAVIRFTSEDREATASDPPLDEDFRSRY